MVRQSSSERPSRRPPIAIVTETPRTGTRRADAARNHELVLAAARRLVRRDGAAALTMDGVAREAGVGKGTVFRRFGDRAGLVHALFEMDERRFQEELLRGEPPLGPGAPARERIEAFGPALVAHRRTHLDLLIQSDRTRPLAHPVYEAWHLHLRILLAEAGTHLDADVAAHMLLATLNPPLLHRLVGTGGDDAAVDSIGATWTRMVAGLLDPATTDR